jgi:hypothetical protein
MQIQIREHVARGWIRRPETVIIAATLTCLIAFWISIRLPHKDGQLIGSDGILYYLYLPSVLLDGDLDLSNNYFDLTGSAGSDKNAKNYIAIGPTVFWAPFFLLAHVLALALNVFGVGISTHGCGYFHQAFVLSGNILYGGLAMWFSYRFVRRLLPERSALYGVILTIFGGNLVYYITAEPSMSHTLSAFLSAVLFDTLVHRRGRYDAGTAAIYGLIGGLMALVRAQDGLMLAAPLLLQLWDLITTPAAARPTYPAITWARNLLIAGIVSLIMIVPQLFVVNDSYGSIIRGGYLKGTFNWFSPKLLPVLFSAHRGLFVWHPIFLVAIAGLWYTAQRDRGTAAMGLFGFTSQWYVIAAWFCWYQGDAFGGRIFLVCTPIFALGLAEVIHRSSELRLRIVTLPAGALLLFLNFLLFVEYRFDLVYRNTPPNWYDLTLGRITFLLERM